MPRHTFTSPDAPKAGGPYSGAVRAGQHVWTAGQCGYRQDKSLVDGLEGQVRQAFANLLLALESAGAGEQDVTAVNVFLADGGDFEEMNAIYAEHFSEPYPVRTTVTVGLRPGVLFEINAQAVTPA